MKQQTYFGEWRSEKAEQKYRAGDAAGWKQAMSAGQPETIDVETEFGSTRAYRWPGSGPTIVFVHGWTDTSVRWIPYAEALQGYDVYALDIMGDVGQSKQAKPFTGADDLVAWLGHALDALDLDHPHIVGYSLGGYLTLAHAGKSDRLASVVVFDPVGVVELQLIKFMFSGVGALLALILPRPGREWLARRMRHPLLRDKAAVKPLLQAQLGHPPKLPPLPTFTDNELRSISVPVRALIGAETNFWDVDKLKARINDQIKNGQADLLPDAGHALAMSHFEECLATVRSAVTSATR